MRGCDHGAPGGGKGGGGVTGGGGAPQIEVVDSGFAFRWCHCRAEDATVSFYSKLLCPLSIAN